MKRKLATIGLFACLSGMFLVGCGEPSIPVEDSVPAVTKQSGEDSNYVTRIRITQDGVTKEVVCVYLSSQSISCDWAGYHKSDSTQNR